MSSLRRVLFLLAALVVLPASAYAQAAISGVVKDASGAVLPGVTVEAASPVLIEKTRSAVTDGTGQYRIINLLPGTYTVTFTLAGFSAIRREDIELTGAFTATVNADLKVGGVAETITVSGETPIVDTQSIRRQTTISNELMTAIPTARSWAATALLIPGIVTIGGGPTDIQVTPQMTVFGGAGGRNNEGRMQVDGLNAGAGLGGSGVSTYVADISNAQEVVTTTSGGLGEVEVGGPTLSIIPEKRRQHASGAPRTCPVSAAGWSAATTATHLRVAGLTTPGQLLRQWDYTFGIGGPIKKDRLWYYVTARDEGQYRSIPNIYPNLNAGDPTKTAVRGRSDPRGAGRRKLAALRRASDVPGVGPQQVQHPLGRTASVQRFDVHHQRGWLPQSAGLRSGLRSAWTRRPDLDDLARGGRLPVRPPARAAADLVLAGDQSPAVRGGVRRLPGALWSLREPGQHDARRSRGSPSSARPDARRTAASRT